MSPSGEEAGDVGPDVEGRVGDEGDAALGAHGGDRTRRAPVDVDRETSIGGETAGGRWGRVDPARDRVAVGEAHVEREHGGVVEPGEHGQRAS